jgi:hypothetical protein
MLDHLGCRSSMIGHQIDVFGQSAVWEMCPRQRRATEEDDGRINLCERRKDVTDQVISFHLALGDANGGRHCRQICGIKMLLQQKCSGSCRPGRLSLPSRQFAYQIPTSPG